MRVAYGIVAAALIWSTPAFATNWYLVAISKSHSTATFVDKDSIEDMGADMRRAHTYQVFNETDESGAAAFNPYLEFDCTTPRYRFVSIKSIDINGKMTRNDVGSGKWRSVDSGSMDEAQRDFVCSGGAKPSDATSWGAGPLIARGRARLNGPKSTGGH
jgi:hypothetical protein